MFLSHALPPFPAEALPPVLAAYVREIAASTQVPVDMAALLALAVVAAAAARRCVVQIGRTHSEPLNLFCAVVMEPGSRKSAIMDMTSPLREHEAALVRREAPTVVAHLELVRLRRAAVPEPAPALAGAVAYHGVRACVGARIACFVPRVHAWHAHVAALRLHV